MKRAFFFSFFLLAASAAHADYIDHFATRTDVGLYKIPSVGETRVLVIPVFIDNVGYEEQGGEDAFLAEIQDFYGSGALLDDGFRFTGWYEQQSLGRYKPVVEVAAPVKFPACPPLGDFADCEIPRGAGVNNDLAGAVDVLVDALKFLNEIFLCASAGPSGERTCTAGGGVSFSSFDNSGNQVGVADGFTDGVIIVSNAGFPGIALPIKDLATQPLLSFFGPHPSFEYDGVTVNSVGIAGRTSRPGRETFVSVHEFGHLLGFCDLYNEDGAATDLPYTVMGGWYYDTPASLLDPFSRVAIGWANIIQVTGDGTFALPPAATTGTVLKIGTGDEFFLVEHRKKIDNALDGDLEVASGVFVERVRLQKRPSPEAGNYFATLQDCVNCTPFDAMLMVEEADGSYDLQHNAGRNDAEDLFQSGDGIGPSDDTDPRSEVNDVFSTNLLSGARTDITITVTKSDDEGAEVEVVAPAVADGCEELGELCVGDCENDDDGGRCGDFAVFPPVADDDGDLANDLAGCPGCSGSAVGLPLVLLLLLRRRRR